MIRKKIRRTAGAVYVILCLAAAGLVWMGSTSQAADGQKKMKLGTSCSLAKKGAAYKSSNREVAYVNKYGLVTAKKQGKVTIQIIKGKTVSKKQINVVANGKKKDAVGVCTGEIGIVKNNITYALVKKDSQEENNTTDVENTQEKKAVYRYTATMKIKNNGKKNAKNIKLMAEIAGKKVIFSFGKVMAGETEYATIEGETEDSQVPELAEENMWDMPVDLFSGKMVLKKLRVYSNDIYTMYDYDKNRTFFV